MSDPNNVIERLMQRALAGEKHALLELCERLKVPVFATALHVGASWKDASLAVLPVLTSFAKDLLAENFETTQWRERMTTAVQMLVTRNDEHEDESTGLSGMASIPRLVKRKAVRAALRQMTLPQLTGVLLKHIDSVGAADMVGVVADTESEVSAILLSAHQVLTDAVEESNSAGDNQ